MEKQRNPGVSRDKRISEEGLERLEKHLKGGTKMTQMVLEQWIKRYGEPARELIKCYRPELGL